MTQQHDNPAAFPRTGATFTPSQEGMTLRDWFAGQALASVIQACAGDRKRHGETVEALFARNAYAIADAMLAARSAQVPA